MSRCSRRAPQVATSEPSVDQTPGALHAPREDPHANPTPVRRLHPTIFRSHLRPLTAPMAAPNFVTRALHMLQSVGWIPAHRFLFPQLRAHLLGWPRFLVPDGRRAALRPAFPST